MSGQVKKFDEHEKMMDEYISKHNPYEKYEPFKFDLRGYSEYIEKHNLKKEDITIELTNKFRTDCK